MADEFSNERLEELQQFESRLRNCTPTAMQIDRDRLMYSAGLASANGEAMLSMTPLPSATGVTSYKSLGWPLATAALLLLSLTLSAAILFRTTEVRVVYVPQSASGRSAEFAALPKTENVQPAASTELPTYLHLRNLVLERGVEALPDTAVAVSHKPKQPPETIFNSPLLRYEF